MGKHYLVQEQESSGEFRSLGHPRQYTVATVMEPDLYGLLIDALNEGDSNRQEALKQLMVTQINNSLSGATNDRSISLTIKNYKVGGLS